MSILCSPTETLLIAEAFYGANSGICPGDTCCVPDDVNDCRVAVSDVNADEWLSIRSICNYESGCDYQYQGQEFSDCGQAVADYLQLVFICASGDFFTGCVNDSYCVTFRV